MHKKPRRMPQMGFTLGHRLVHLPPSQWVEVYDDPGREVGFHRDVEGFFKNALSESLDMQLQVVEPKPEMEAMVHGHGESFETLVHKLAQHQEEVAKSKGKKPTDLHYTWRRDHNRYKLTLS